MPLHAPAQGGLSMAKNTSPLVVVPIGLGVRMTT